MQSKIPCIRTQKGNQNMYGCFFLPLNKTLDSKAKKILKIFKKQKPCFFLKEFILEVHEKIVLFYL